MQRVQRTRRALSTGSTSAAFTKLTRLVNATKKQEAINPEPVYFTSGKYEGLQKWALVWDERQYDLWQDMMDPSKFSFTFDDCWGFNDDLKTICNTILFDPMFHGESFTKLSAEYSPVIDSIING